jgi:hypothetical protein
VATAESTGAVFPLSEREQRIWAEIEWAEQNEELRTKYGGQWIALVGHTVVAHGPERAEVLRAASAATQQPSEELAVWFLMESAAQVADYPLDADSP